MGIYTREPSLATVGITRLRRGLRDVKYYFNYARVKSPPAVRSSPDVGIHYYYGRKNRLDICRLKRAIFHTYVSTHADG